jgi:2-oxo-4-hydroxy-4-carboxy-5-ureidoimidazoline decarboxylase
MTMEQANALSRGEFVEQLGWVFERSPWVAERAWASRPFASLEALHAAMTAAMEGATHNEQLALLRAHPELGSRGPMSEASTGEQAGAGFSSGKRYRREPIQEYRARFGFPFIYAVKGSTIGDIMVALTLRIEGAPEEEFQQALCEVRRIAWFRLQDTFKESH